METTFLIAALFNFGVNLIFTIIALVIGVLALIMIDKKILKNLELEAEMKKGNIAVAIFASTILLFIAIIISFGLQG